MSDKIIEFYVAASWNAQTHRIFTRPPANWDGMSTDEQREFIDHEAQQWAEEELEIGSVVYDDPSEIDNDRWGDSYDPDWVEDMFDSAPPRSRSSLDCEEDVQLEVVDEP